MDLTTAKKLIELNTQFYATNSESFAQTRSNPWEGWQKVFDFIKDDLMKYADLNDNSLEVNDFACGNMRFEKYLCNQLKNLKISVNAYDNCEMSIIHGIDLNLNFVKTDILNALINNLTDGFNLANLTVSFGFMHHIPTSFLRQCLMQMLINSTQKQGFIVISFWEFAKDENTYAKAARTTNEYKNINQIPDFEDNDFIIGWKNIPNAYRYCHSFTKYEVDNLILKNIDNIRLITEFLADGKDGKRNRYLILQRI